MKRGYFKNVGTSAALGSITSLRNIGKYDSKHWYASNSGTTLAVYSVASLTGAATAEHTRATAAGATIHNAALRINADYIMAAWMVSYSILGTTYYFVYVSIYTILTSTWTDVAAYSVGTTEGRIIDIFKQTSIWVLFTDGTTLKIASVAAALTVVTTLATLKDDQAVWGGYYNDIIDDYEFLVYKNDDKFYKVVFTNELTFTETEYDYFDPPAVDIPMPNRFQVGDEKMGGIISITIRLPDGTEYRTQRWTNSFTYWFHDVRFLTKDIDFIMSYLKGWLDMKADYETKAFKLPDTFRYFPSKGLVPVEYGIWVIDLQKNEIVDYYQNYTDLTRLSFDFDLNANDSSDVEEMNRITQLLLDHRLSCEGEGFSYQSFDELRQGHPKYRDIYVDLSPLKLTRYKPHQAKEALAHIQKLGFVFNATELRIWDEWIKEYQKNHVLNKDFIYCPSCGDKVYSDVMKNYDADGQWECGACGYRFVLEGIH